jgi:hypothetical protein
MYNSFSRRLSAVVCAEREGWEPNVTLHVLLDMYILSGPIKPGMAKDKRIMSFDTAVQHEVQKRAAKGA